MIYLNVTMIIKEGRMDDFLEVCREVRPLVLAEEGCLMYDHTRDLDVNGEDYHERRITLYEKWSGQDALDAHLKTDHMARFSKAVAEMREKVTVHRSTEAY